MIRKLIKQGRNTLTLSLPRKWCDRNKLEEGDEISLIEKGEHLLLTKKISKGSGKVTVDITGLDRSTIILLIMSLYRYGYDSIVINTKTPTAMYYFENKRHNVSSIVDFAINRLIGAELVSSTKDSYNIQVLIDESREKFDIVLRRIFRLLIEMFDTFMEGARKRDRESMQTVQFQQANLRKFINYGIRLLNKFGYTDAEKTSFYFAIIMFLTKISEIIKNFAGYTITEGTLNLSERFCNLLEEINNAVKHYYTVFYKYDIKQISEMHKNRDRFKKRFYKEYPKLSKYDLFILSNMMQILDMLLDLNELKMSIGYS